MSAIMITIGDLICLQSFMKLISKETKYACNLGSETEHICLQSFAIGTKYGYNHRKFDFLRFVQKSKSRVPKTISVIASIFGPLESNCKHIWSVLDLRLQAYLVPFEIQIASILGPHCNHDCKLITALG